MDGPEILVVGGGIVGTATALELRRRLPRAAITLLEKEARPGAHASGRNSGVLHAGFYYTADSLKARFCREGNAELRAWIRARNLPLRECGKLVVAKDASELPALEELARRAAVNGVQAELVSGDEARRIEPRVRTAGRALWSPTTAASDPLAVIGAMTAEAVERGVEVRSGIAYLRGEPGRVLTSAGELRPRFVLNCAGLHADRVARDFGFSRHHVILPFKGLYLYSGEAPGALKTHVYPVPDLKFPFLGVHFTVTADGHVKIGPTALPALWREQYGGLSGFSLRDLAGVAARNLGLLFKAGFNYRALAKEELAKCSRMGLVRRAAALIEGVREEDYRELGRPGIRAQLMDTRTKALVGDFLLEGDASSLHVLNAVSPAWTCAIPFARHVADRIAALGGPGK